MELRSKALKNAKHLVEEKMPAEYDQQHVCVRQYISDRAPECTSEELRCAGLQELNAIAERSHQTIFIRCFWV